MDSVSEKQKDVNQKNYLFLWEELFRTLHKYITNIVHIEVDNLSFASLYFSGSKSSFRMQACYV